MNITQRVINAYTAFAGIDKTQNSSSNDANAFLRYGNRHKRLLQDWSQVEMSDEDMYTGYSYAAINKRANRAAVLGKRFLYTEAAQKIMDQAKAKDEQLKHPYIDLIKKSKEFTEKKFWNDISTYLDLEGVYYLMAVRAIRTNAQGETEVGAIQKFTMLNPYNVKRVRKEATGAIGGYIESRDGMYREIPKEMIIEIRLLNPFNNDIPFSMTDAAKESQFTMKQAGDYTRHSIKGNINAPGAITTDVILEDQIFDNFVSRIKNHEKGEPIYGNGAGAINWQSMQVDLDKASLDKINEIHRSTLFAVSGVSKTSMGIEESGTGREVSKTQKDDFTENAVMPQIEDIIDALNLDYRQWYPEWDTNEYEILLDNPLESDREAELKDIEIREKEYEMTNRLQNLGYEFEIAAKYAHGDISLEELGEPTLEEEISDEEAEAIAAREMGLETIDSEPEEGNEIDELNTSDRMRTGNALNRFKASREGEEYEMVRNKFVPKEENEKRLKEARKRVKDKLKAKKEADKLAKAAKKEAKKEEQTPTTPVTPKPENLPDEEVPLVKETTKTVTKTVEPVLTPNNVDDRLKALNQIAARDYPDLYDGMGIDMDKLGCIMVDTESIPVLQFVKNPDQDLYRETNYNQSPVPGETEAHVTLLFGLLENGNIWKDKVNQLLVGWSLPTVTIEKVSHFDLGDSYAIIGLVKKTPELIDGHERLTLLPHINTFSEYHPHITLAYIKHDESLLDKWITPLSKKYNGQKVATTGINYGDLPEDDEEEKDHNHIEDEHSLEEAENVIKKKGSQYCIYSEKGKKLSCHDSKKEAKERLAEIEYFKHKDNTVSNEAKQAVLTPIEAPVSHDCSKHGFVPNSTLEKATNALDPEIRDSMVLTQANLQNAVARLEGEALRKVISALRRGDINEIEKIIEEVEEEEGGILAELVITFAAFYTVLFPIYAAQLMSLRLAEFGVHGIFNMNEKIENDIKRAARKAAESHLRTVMQDFINATDNAVDEVTERKLIELVMDKVASNDDSVLGKLPTNPNRSDVQKAVRKGKFDDDPAYALARKYAREGAGLNEIEKALRNTYDNMTETRAKTIARHESSRVFTMSQYEADKQFLQESGYSNNAYKRLRSRTGEPCAVCESIIAKTKADPIPFAKNFADLGEELTATYKKENGKMAVQKVAVNYEPIRSGNVHVNCNCEYELVIKRDDGTFMNDLRYSVDNAKGDGYNPYRDSQGRFDDGLSVDDLKKMVASGTNKSKVEKAKKRLSLIQEARKHTSLKSFLQVEFDKRYLGDPVDDITIKDSISDPETLREMFRDGELEDGIYEGGNDYLYEVKEGSLIPLKEYRTRFDWITGEYTIYKRDSAPKDVRTVPIYHNTDAENLKATDLDITRSGSNFGGVGGNEFTALYFRTNPTDDSFGFNTVEAKLNSDAQTVDYRDLLKEYGKTDEELSLDEFAQKNYDVVVKYDDVGEAWEVIVLNSDVLQNPEIDLVEVYQIAHGIKSSNAKGDGYNPYRDSKGRFDEGLSIVEIEKMLKKGGNKEKIAKAKKRLDELSRKYPGRKYGEKFEAYADRYIQENPEKAIKDYQKQVMKEFKSPIPNIVAADEAKKIIPGFEAERSADYHEPASSFAKDYYRALLANESSMHLPVIFTAGGTGAGKSTALTSTMEAYDQYAAVYDGNLAGFDSAKGKIDAALATGRNVELTFVDRDPVTAFKYGVIPRTATEGRTITIKDHIQTHLDSRDVIVRMEEEYKDNPNVKITIVDNNGGLGDAHEVPLENISKNVYNKESLQKELEDEAKIARDNGQISKEVYGLITNETADTVSEQKDDSKSESTEKKHQIISRQEAEKSTKDSAYKKVLWHGTSADASTSIISNGFEVKEGDLSTRLYGDGIYLTKDPVTAHSYASTRDKDTPRTVGVMIDVKNIFTENEEPGIGDRVNEAMIKAGHWDSPPDNPSFTQFQQWHELYRQEVNTLLEKYDAIEIPADDQQTGMIVVKDPSAVKIFRVSDSKEVMDEMFEEQNNGAN